MTVNEVMFDDINLKNYGLYPLNVDIETPKAKRKVIEIAGMDGMLDLSTALDGILRYNNRKIVIELQCFAKDEEYAGLESKFKNDFNGKRVKISFDTDCNYYYIGFVEIEWTSEDVIDVATVTIDCDPYKYKRYRTVVEKDINTSGIVILINERMPSSPIVETSTNMTLSFMVGNREISREIDGASKLIELCMLTGEYQIKITGTGHIKFEWQEGAL